jgi:sensor c-di-GMP phosphodiesterase-like protein
MANELGLKVIAEGVEVEAQLEFLRQHGCDEFQGFLYSKALPEDQLVDLLRQRKTDRVNVNA